MKIVHVIVGLDAGGAEGMLLRLLTSHASSASYHHTVISLTHAGSIRTQVEQLGVPVVALGLRGAADLPIVFWRLVRTIRRAQPDIVQTWMYHADLLGGVAAKLAGVRRVLWGIRCSVVRIPIRIGGILPTLRVRRPLVVVNALLSKLVPTRIICCAVAARASHADAGFDESKLLVVQNGYYLAPERSTASDRLALRAAFGISNDSIVVGFVGRFSPLKGYDCFIDAASRLAAKHPKTTFLLIGRGVDASNALLQDWIRMGGRADRFILASERRDISDCMSAMDVFCSSSTSEGFPNVICEAMAAGVPCVVTDVGDAAEIVGETGVVVPPAQPDALLGALDEMVSIFPSERRRLGELARKRIETHYSLESARARFEAVYRSVAP